MKKLITGFVTLFSLNGFSSDLSVTTCKDYDLSLNSVYSMKKYANESIKIFEIDMIEPAGAPVGVAVAIDRGEELSEMESFCRFIPGLTSVKLKKAKSEYDESSNSLTLTMPASQMDADGNVQKKDLVIRIVKGSKIEGELVSASLIDKVK